MLNVKIQKTFSSNKNTFYLDVDFSIEKQDGITVFFGSSGSGKTLTLQGITGLYKAENAFIKFQDIIYEDTKNNIFLPIQKRGIGFVFQDYALFPHLTVLQNVAYSQSKFLSRFISKQTKQDCLQILEKLQIAHLANNYPYELSGGQKQRVAIARAYIAKSKLLFLDEPFSALDPLLRISMREELKNQLSVQQIPTILITHDPEDVLFFADTLILFNHGTAKKITNFKQNNFDLLTLKEYLLENIK